MFGVAKGVQGGEGRGQRDKHGADTQQQLLTGGDQEAAVWNQLPCHDK